jgi:phosphoenolpyruvate-protein kinase (PTS system EI component)
VLTTTAAMAEDPALVQAAERLVTDRGLPAPRAVWEAAEQFIAALRAAGGYLAERARDHPGRRRLGDRSSPQPRAQRSTGSPPVSTVSYETSA